MSLPFAAKSVRLKSTELLSSIVTPNAPGIAALVGSKAQARISGIGSSWVKFDSLVTDWARFSVSYQWFSVKDFGAVGDGVANDTMAIQAAADAIGVAGGGNLFFPAGDYKIEAEITISAPTGMSGQGSGSRIIKSGVFQRLFNFSGVSGCRVANLSIDMALATGEGISAEGLSFTGCGLVIVEDCEITNTEGIGVGINACSKASIMDTWFSNCDADAISMQNMAFAGSVVTRCVLDDATININVVPGISITDTMMFFATHTKDSIYIVDSVASIVSSSIASGNIFIEKSRARIESSVINAISTNSIAVATDTMSLFSMGGNVIVSDGNSIGVRLVKSERNQFNDNIILSTSNSRLFYSTETSRYESFTDNMVIATGGTQDEMVYFYCTVPANVAGNGIVSTTRGATTAIGYDGNGAPPTISDNYGQGQVNGIVLTGSYTGTPLISANQFDVTNGVVSSVSYCAGWSPSGAAMMVCSGDPGLLALPGEVGSFASNKAGEMGSSLYTRDAQSWFPISGDVILFSTDSVGTAVAASWISPNGGPMLPVSTVGAVSVILRRVAKVVIRTVAGVGAANIDYEVRMNGVFVGISTSISNTFTGITTITLASPISFTALTVLTVHVTKSAVVATGQAATVMVVLV